MRGESCEGVEDCAFTSRVRVVSADVRVGLHAVVMYRENLPQLIP